MLTEWRLSYYTAQALFVLHNNNIKKQQYNGTSYEEPNNIGSSQYDGWITT